MFDEKFDDFLELKTVISYLFFENLRELGLRLCHLAELF